MRIAIVGAAAAAAVGGALAVSPLSVNSPVSMPKGTCTGQQCERMQSVLLPDRTTNPGHIAPTPPAPETVPPGLPPQPAMPAAARAVPRGDGGAARFAVPGIGQGSGASGVGAPELGTPALAPPGLPDLGLPILGLPDVGIPGIGLPDASGLLGLQNAWGTATGVVSGVLGIAGSISGVVATSALAVTYVVLAINALNAAGVLPPGILPGSTGAASLLGPAAGLGAAALLLGPAAGAGLPALALTGALPAQAVPPELAGVLPALVGGLPALAGGVPPDLASALPAVVGALPAVAGSISGGLPAVPPLPQLPVSLPQVPLPQIAPPRLCSPPIGPFGPVCTS